MRRWPRPWRDADHDPPLASSWAISAVRNLPIAIYPTPPPGPPPIPPLHFHGVVVVVVVAVALLSIHGGGADIVVVTAVLVPPPAATLPPFGPPHDHCLIIHLFQGKLPDAHTERPSGRTDIAKPLGTVRTSTYFGRN
jgi:hypothetical protein